MINYKDYKELIGKNVIVSCTDGQKFKGEWSEVFYADEDEEQQEDAILIDREHGAPLRFPFPKSSASRKSASAVRITERIENGQSKG